ncbi:MAG: terminase small subunit [Rhodanobacter sp.]
MAKNLPASKPARVKVAAKKTVKKPQQKRAVSRVDVFVNEYLIDLNGHQAAIRAGYSPKAARQTASELLALPDVRAKVQAAMDERAARTGISADAVLERFWTIATADARELTELHVGCCRFCWGKRSHYQWKPSELREAKAEYKRQHEACGDEAARKRLVPVDDVGGVGFNPVADPNPKCPECFGHGVERPIAKDTRDLSPAARMLYAGIKTTQHGLEVKTHSQADALLNIGKHLGLFRDRVEVTGKDGGPLAHTIGDVLGEIDGAGTGLPKHAIRDK